MSLRVAGVFLIYLIAPCAWAQKDILLITLDTTRADHLSCYGYPQKTSPELDAFARGAARYTRAYAPVPYTLPAHATLMTGLWPKDHGVRDNLLTPLPPAVPFAPVLLEAEGYRTAAFVSSFILDRRFGLARGFARYDDKMTVQVKDDEQGNERPAPDTTEAVLAYLSGLPDGGRVFLWVHYYDPHSPYRNHPGSPPGMGAYDGEILFMDQGVGKVLEAWNKRHKGLVVVTADHGESLGDHGESYHGIFLYEPCVRVPLLVRAEGRTVSGVDDRLTSLADVAATILEFAGVLAPPMTGRSLLSPGLLHDRLYFESFVPADNFGWSPPFGLLKDGFKYIHLPRPELYDLARDGAEKNNLVDVLRPKAREMRTFLENGYGLSYVPPLGLPDAETLRRLEALGYRGGSTAHPGKDPKDLVWVVDEMDRAREFGKGGRFEEAEKIYKRILRANPENSPVRFDLCAMLKRQGRRKEARGLLLQGLDSGSTDAYILYNLGVMDFEEDSLESARRRFKAVLVLAPEHVDSMLSLFWVAFKKGDSADAAGYLDRARKVDPENPKVYLLRGLMAGQAGNLKEAVGYFIHGLKLKPDFVDALNGLGQAYFQMGRFDESVEAYKSSLTANPDQPEIYLHLGSILLTAKKNPSAALAYYREFLTRYPENAEASNVRDIVQGMTPPPR